MSELRVVVHVLVLAALALSARADDEKIAQDELVRRTQELFCSVALGNQAPWKQYFAEDAVYFDEKGRSMDKTALVADVTPLPKGYSGSIKLMNAHSRMIGRTAILTYDLDESKTIYGQNMTARYHGTDTWLFRDGRWQIVAGQMFRYYEDPAPGKVEIARLNDYVGTYELAPGITLTISLAISCTRSGAIIHRNCSCPKPATSSSAQVPKDGVSSAGTTAEKWTPSLIAATTKTWCGTSCDQPRSSRHARLLRRSAVVCKPSLGGFRIF